MSCVLTARFCLFSSVENKYFSPQLSISTLGYSLLSVIADFFTALLLRATGEKLQAAYSQSLKSLGLDDILRASGNSDIT